MSARVLVVDDHRASAETLTEALIEHGYDAVALGSGAEALASLRDSGGDVVVTDLRMDGLDGIALLREVQAADPCVPVLLVTAHASIDAAVEATRGGAFCFLTKPLRVAEVLVQVRNAAEQGRLARAVRGTGASSGEEIVGRSASLLRALSIADRAARSDSTVLIMGESGTGKELFARRIHQLGPRSARPFIAVNCGAIPDSLLEAELFGAARGAYTGASSDRIGLIESAQRGTLFLEEIGELSPGAQTRLLRFLQEGTIRRVGEVQDRQVDARVVAASHQDLRGDGFREDLFYRLHVIPLELPPLRARRDDIPVLFGVALKRACDRQGRPVPRVSGDALDLLMGYDWPGNVRELFNLAERFAVLCAGDAVVPADLPREIALASAPLTTIVLPEGDFDLTGFLGGLEERALRRALARNGGVKAQAAASLGLERNAFRYKLKKYGIGE